MSFVLTKGTDDEYASEFAYVACAYACVASENQALERDVKPTYHIARNLGQDGGCACALRP